MLEELPASNRTPFLVEAVGNREYSVLLLSRGWYDLGKKFIKAAIANACAVCRFDYQKSSNSPPEKLSSAHFEFGGQGMEDLKVHC